MKNILNFLFAMSALALASCSTPSTLYTRQEEPTKEKIVQAPPAKPKVKVVVEVEVNACSNGTCGHTSHSGYGTKSDYPTADRNVGVGGDNPMVVYTNGYNPAQQYQSGNSGQSQWNGGTQTSSSPSNNSSSDEYYYGQRTDKGSISKGPRKP